MDDIVKAAMAKWPGVPHCYGWLGLDRRGRWYMRDDIAQAAGAFPASKGSLLIHDKLIAFIERNYLADEHGQWFFQNGPQRVYVELEATPFVWRLLPGGAVSTHTGRVMPVQRTLTDEEGRLYLVGEGLVGLVDGADMLAAADRIESGEWQPEPVTASALPGLFGYVRSPSARHAASIKGRL
ncbi:DUF2946 family protein [uncultured Hydrogenophaga sp.]|uniref:DUF2946 family protein n=1 Tax=uncultured Hydrogenophaga sp. TaxID=199683 RepID=UPI00265F1F6C|nr:DUF2946 family protein [uncultured Hydrogenophaga sp.]